MDDRPPPPPWRRLARRLVEGEGPSGVDWDACRAVVRSSPGADAATPALVMLLEATLADATTPIDDVQDLVPMIKALGRGETTPAELLRPAP